MSPNSFFSPTISESAASYSETVSQTGCFCQNFYITFTMEKEAQNWSTSAIFTKTTQSKQSPNRRKFAQSGHPDLSMYDRESRQ
jgi:hypothetical protein